MIEFCLENSRLIVPSVGSATEAARDDDCRMLAARMDERRLSLRLSSWCASRMAVSIEPWLASCSAVSSSWATLLAMPMRPPLGSGLGCRRGRSPCDDVVRKMTGCCGCSGGGGNDNLGPDGWTAFGWTISLAKEVVATRPASGPAALLVLGTIRVLTDLLSSEVFGVTGCVAEADMFCRLCGAWRLCGGGATECKGCGDVSQRVWASSESADVVDLELLASERALVLSLAFKLFVCTHVNF